MQLHILLFASVFAISCGWQSTAEQDIPETRYSMPDLQQEQYYKLQPLVARLLRAFADRLKGSIIDLNAKDRTTSRLSMECWCAAKSCNCATARVHGECVEISELDYGLNLLDRCTAAQMTPPSTYSCESDAFEDVIGSVAIESSSQFAGRCPFGGPACRGAKRISMECWCGPTGNCLCGNANDQQRTFNCTSKGARINTRLLDLDKELDNY